MKDITDLKDIIDLNNTPLNIRIVSGTTANSNGIVTVKDTGDYIPWISNTEYVWTAPFDSLKKELDEEKEKNKRLLRRLKYLEIFLAIRKEKS